MVGDVQKDSDDISRLPLFAVGVAEPSVEFLLSATVVRPGVVVGTNFAIWWTRNQAPTDLDWPIA